ncbi:MULTISPECIES: MSMEG_0565 family glycosyltransferase [Cyanophyceae]|uniref:MSMEG_0565 family glycosyltransferase n=1 Tax=Cyanophyceae TaxID=3028117 RepID=UPI00168336F9|nr:MULTISPECIES: MSMEG_0565 family glycosyltransferase [Cyanophyceae]MBD1915943.1 MSMEG_0565 family glycosyltransferase [Phormidium sp. FACHB-77]MBD2030383.1 MSMEG_0565 family glycosyltransferase [Phormidium sp. FACHB-322]MBD2053385.1 MSMEG_0565 family glycosyltransferase [Leptolyngbya sp. FACHB-60]
MAQPLKIALLTYSTKLRGSVVHTLELATALTDLGHQVCVYALDKDGRGFERAVPAKVQLVPAEPPPDGLPPNQATDALIRQRIQEFVDYFLAYPEDHHDIYHAQDCIGANALVQLRQQGRLPNVVRTVHHIEDYPSIYLQHCQDKSIRDPDLCLCVSDRWHQALRDQYGIESPRVLNGVDLRRFFSNLSGQEDALKARYGLTGSPIYLTIGGIEPRKNSLRLLEAFAQVLTTYPEAQLVIAGGATLFDYEPYRQEFFALAEHLAQQHGPLVGKSVILAGVIADDDLPALYRAADVFCFPSTKEGWGLVVLEAIASGLPVITADQPPFIEFLSSNQALLVNPDSASAIAAAMLAVLDPRVADQLVQHSQAVLPNYTWGKSASLHLTHYQTLI